MGSASLGSCKSAVRNASVEESNFMTVFQAAGLKASSSEG